MDHDGLPVYRENLYVPRSLGIFVCTPQFKASICKYL